MQNLKYYLYVGRLVDYKKIDLLLSVFNKLNERLIIVGIGRKKFKSYKNIQFVGYVSDKELIKYYHSAKALIMPQEEDFGIVAVEAQSFGVPVIAFAKGGALDTVVDGKTGILFDKQNVESLASAIEKFSKMSFNDKIVKANAKRFTKEIFKRQLQKSLVRAYSGWRRRNQALAKILR